MTLIEQLATSKGFLTRYLEHLQTCETQTEAYTKTENEHMKIFKRRRYSNFESFRQVKNRAIKVNQE